MVHFAIWSQIIMIGLSLGYKCINSFFHSFCVVQGIEDSSFEFYSLSLAQVLVLFYGLLCGQQGRQRFICDFLCNFNHFLMQLLSWIHFAYNAQLISPFGVNEFRSKDISICIHSSGNPRQSKYTKGYLCVPPMPGINPSLSYGKANLAYSEQNATSVSSASSHPPPSATPLTPHMTGFLALQMESCNSLKMSLFSKSLALLPVNSLILAPAQNAFLTKLKKRMTFTSLDAQ